MDDDADPLSSYSLCSIRLEDQPTFDLLFSACREPLSDYTFANTFVWRDSIHLRWRAIRDCLCVFANGDGGLTMLFPPLGPGDAQAALRECLDVCEAYNAAAGLAHWTRIEYVSDEVRPRLGGPFLGVPMSGDYVYPTRQMIELAGGDLASKRQARNRFARRYAARTETLEARHLDACLALLNTWCRQTDHVQVSGRSVDLKRAKEVAATTDALRHADALGLTGMVLYAGDELAGFTLGERLDGQTCSIIVEKTDRRFVGSAQYIFSEFCRQYWSETAWCNVGDDWDVPSLAWTKQSYRPSHRLAKYVLRPATAVVPEVAPARPPVEASAAAVSPAGAIPMVAAI